jgi:hypothetical protein
MLLEYFVVVDRQQQIDQYWYHLLGRLAMSGVYKFYMEHQMLIVLNSLLGE